MPSLAVNAKPDAVLRAVTLKSTRTPATGELLISVTEATTW